MRDARDALVERFGPEFVWPNGWAATLFTPARAPKFSKLEEMAGMSKMRPWYKFTSHRVHAGSKAAALTVQTRGSNRFLMAGPTNAFLADPGHGALISLAQVTTCLLLRTRIESLGVEPLRIVDALGVLDLAERAGDAFLEAHRKLESDEERLWQ